MTPDHINGLFELAGSANIWWCCWCVYKHKGYAGVTPAILIFFCSWGGWNLYYYPHLMQQWSFVGGISMFIADVAWGLLMLWYGPVQRRDW